MGELDIFNDEADPLAELEDEVTGRIKSGDENGVDSAVTPVVEGSMSNVSEVQPQEVQQQEERQVMAKAEKAEKVKKTPVGLTDDVAKQVRQYQAKLMLATGDKVSASDAIGAALKIALK